MKTDQFDDEIRRKLLGLPADSDAGDAERIFGYVRAHRPSGFGGGDWGKGLLFVAGASLFIGSLLCNLNQYHSTQNLYVTLDSLQHQFTQLQAETRQVVTAKNAENRQIIRTDTVYINRYRDRFVTLVPPEIRPVPTRPAPDRVTFNPEGTNGTTTQQATALDDRPDALATERSDLIRTPATLAKKGNATTEIPEALMPDGVSASKAALHLTRKKAQGVAKSGLQSNPQTPEQPSLLRPVTRPATQPEIANDPIIGSRKIPRTNPFARTGQLTELNSGMPVKPDEVPINTSISVKQLTPIGIPLSLPTSVISRPLVSVPSVMSLSARRTFRMLLPSIRIPKLAVNGSSVWAGINGAVGNEHMSGSVLGEWRLKPRWSIQAGIQYAVLYGDGFDDDEHFEARTQQDFRALYAPNVPRTDEIHDISQTYQLLQIPITVAYHYPLGLAWSLRFGLGTNLELNAVNRVTFDYRESSNTTLRGLYETIEPLSLLNSVTVSAGLERQWRSWLFRASPFISPQLKPVAYKPDNLYWGGQLQLLHRFGRLRRIPTHL